MIDHQPEIDFGTWLVSRAFFDILARGNRFLFLLFFLPTQRTHIHRTQGAHMNQISHRSITPSLLIFYFSVSFWGMSVVDKGASLRLSRCINVNDLRLVRFFRPLVGNGVAYQINTNLYI